MIILPEYIDVISIPAKHQLLTQSRGVQKILHFTFQHIIPNTIPLSSEETEYRINQPSWISSLQAVGSYEIGSSPWQRVVWVTPMIYEAACCKRSLISTHSIMPRRKIGKQTLNDERLGMSCMSSNHIYHSHISSHEPVIKWLRWNFTKEIQSNTNKAITISLLFKGSILPFLKTNIKCWKLSIKIVFLTLKPIHLKFERGTLWANKIRCTILKDSMAHRKWRRRDPSHLIWHSQPSIILYCKQMKQSMRFFFATSHL